MTTTIEPRNSRVPAMRDDADAHTRFSFAPSGWNASLRD